MDFILLLLLFITVTSVILVALKDSKLYDITANKPFLSRLPQATLGLFILLAISISFYEFKTLLNSMETMAFTFMFGFLIKILWSMLTNKKDECLWLKIWAGVSIATGVIELIVYKSGSIISNIVEFGVILICCFLALVIMGLIKKHEYVPHLVKTLFVGYGILALLFGFIPPFDIEVAIATWIIVLIPGAIVGGLIYLIYKKRVAPIDEISQLGDNHETKEII